MEKVSNNSFINIWCFTEDLIFTPSKIIMAYHLKTYLLLHRAGRFLCHKNEDPDLVANTEKSLINDFMNIKKTDTIDFAYIIARNCNPIDKIKVEDIQQNSTKKLETDENTMTQPIFWKRKVFSQRIISLILHFIYCSIDSILCTHQDSVTLSINFSRFHFRRISNFWKL